MIWEKKIGLYICCLFNVCTNNLELLQKYKGSIRGLKSFKNNKILHY